LSPKFGFFEIKTSNYFQDKKSDSDSVQSVTDKELLEIIENGKKVFDTSQSLLG
jgi:hypothetical protein